MAYSEHFENFIDSYNAGRCDTACDYLIKELGELMVDHKSDFIVLLKESGIEANNEMSDEKLIDLFIDNIGTNKNLCIGASILVNIYNKKIGFDGEDQINDDAVKASYDALQENYSGLIWDNIIKGGIKLAKNVINNQRAKNQPQAPSNNQAAKQAMLLANQQKKAKQQAAQKKKDDETKKKKMMWIIGGSVAGLAVIGLIIYLVKRKK